MDEPSSEQQLEFLANLQRLFAEGSFFATYKFALLSAIADLSVDQGEDTAESGRARERRGQALTIDLRTRDATPFAFGEGVYSGRGRPAY